MWTENALSIVDKIKGGSALRSSRASKRDDNKYNAESVAAPRQ